MGIFNDVTLPPARRPSEGSKRVMSVQAALDWAFRREYAQLLPPDSIEPEGYRPGVSTIWVMIQRGNLGCKIEGGGSSDPHEDADVIAAIVSMLPDALGGFRKATEIAEMARHGMTPDWMPNATPTYGPVARTFNQHGWQASVADSRHLGALGWLPTKRRNKKGVVVEEEVRFCPVTFTPTAAQVAAARRRYLDWYACLLEIRHNLRICKMLKTIEVSEQMPPMTPWRKE